MNIHLPAILMLVVKGFDPSPFLRTLFCFAWSPRRKNDEGVLNEAVGKGRYPVSGLLETDGVVVSAPVEPSKNDVIHSIDSHWQIAV